jgi:PAS domain S-box-containing protein
VNGKLQDFAEQYACALKAYLATPGEESLHKAYDLGRGAIIGHLGALDIVWIHQEALSSILDTAAPGDELSRSTKLSSTFILEGLAAFEMTHRGFLEALVQLSEDAIQLGRTNQLLEAEIRDRREAEASLRKRESQLAEAQGVAHIGSWEWDITADTVTWTDELYRLFRLQRDSTPLTYSRYLACIHPDDREMLDATIRRAAESRQLFEIDHRLFGRNGEERWIHSIGRVVVDKTGATVRMVGTAQDITERKQVDAALRRSEELFRSLIENSLDVITILNADGTIRYKSPSVRNVLGYSEQDLLGQSVFDFVHPDEMARIAEDFRSCIGEADYTTTTILRFRHRDGGWRTMECLAKNLLGVPGIGGILVTSRDITEKLRLEEELHDAVRQREHEARQFATRVQRVQEEERQRIARELHDDICQRLTALRLHINLLEDDATPPGDETRKQLRSVKLQLDLMITDVRRLSANLRPMALDLFGLEAALRTLCEEVQRAHGVSVRFECEGNAWTRENPDTGIALYRIAQEGLNNAARHSAATGITLSLSRADETIVLRIRDDGKGFEPGQAPRQDSPLHGFGLNSMQERAELLGGTFRIMSTPLGGTTICAELPAGRP